MKVCEITGKVAVIGNNVSHSHHKTKRKFSPNLKNKRFWSEEEGRWICRRNQNNQHEGPRSSAPRSCRTQKGLLKLK